MKYDTYFTRACTLEVREIASTYEEKTLLLQNLAIIAKRFSTGMS